MTMNIIHVTPKGARLMIHDDKIPLHTLGKVKVRRISNVNFNEETQKWEVSPVGNPGEILFTHKSRDKCIQWEIRYFGKKLPEIFKGV